MGYTEMCSTCLPDSTENETLLRSQHAELREWLTEALLLLTEQERLVFTLHYYERLTPKEIQQLVDATESTISQVHASALCRLHASLLDRANCALRLGAKTRRKTQ
jgi:RNA polymerase sigma factor FliA